MRIDRVGEDKYRAALAAFETEEYATAVQCSTEAAGDDVYACTLMSTYVCERHLQWCLCVRNCVCTVVD